jgi:hypothetical protein
MMSERARTIFTFALAPLFALAFAWLVSAYWRFFHIGTAGGNGMALLFIILPLTLLVFCAVAAGINRIARRARLSSVARGFATIAAFATVLALMFAMEVRRTADYPQESEEPVDVRDFLSALVGG